ncbi:MAG: Uma2 family endonuclease [Bacteroidetes bacterium]|nr:Uma2 family endonuclease [Bacteroidota bacterium]
MEEAIKKKLSVEEYFELEKNSEIRHEYYQGEIFDMAGASKKHNIIAFNCASALKNALKRKQCDVFIQDLRLETLKDIYYTYPDVVVTCDKRDNDEYMVKYPFLIIEVISESTEDHDRGFKFVKYRNIKSLQYYIMVSQKEYLVECYTRGEKQMWMLNTYSSLNDTIVLSKLSVKLALKDIYEGI